MGIGRLLGVVMDEMSVEDLYVLKAHWEGRLEAAKASGDFPAVKVCERMIKLQQDRIKARKGSNDDADDHGL